MISDLYPNPVSEFAFLEYQLNNEDTEAKILIHNVLGSVVGEYPLSNHEKQIKISAQELNDGLYFYTLNVEGKSLATKKLIVKK